MVFNGSDGFVLFLMVLVLYGVYCLWFFHGVPGTHLFFVFRTTPCNLWRFSGVFYSPFSMTLTARVCQLSNWGVLLVLRNLGGFQTTKNHQNHQTTAKPMQKPPITNDQKPPNNHQKALNQVDKPPLVAGLVPKPH